MFKFHWFLKASGVTAVCFALSIGCAKSGGQAQPPSVTPAPEAYEWTQVVEHAAYPEGYNFPVFAVKGRMWAFHAEGIWESTDAKAWTKSVLPSIRSDIYKTQYVLFKDSVYALGDNSGNSERMSFSPRVRRTTDFRKWEDVAARSNLPDRIFAGVVVFNDKIWLIGGYDGRNYHNDIWNSADGKTWARVSAAAAWSPRTIAAAAVFKEKLLVIGGGVIDGSVNPNPNSDKEIWSSADGVSWNRMTTNLQNRSGGFPIVFDNKLWLVGANRDGTFARSSLVSDDGGTWSEVAAPWSPRGGAAAWVIGGKLYMTGGKYSVTENGQIRFIYSNDVWVMSKK